MLTETVKELLQENLEALGRGRPARRAAMKLAIIMMDDRHNHWALDIAEQCCEKIQRRISSAKVI